MITFRPPRGTSWPTGTGEGVPLEAQAPTTVSASSGSYRLMTVKSAEIRRPISPVTAANTSSGGAALATSTAMRRSAACCSASARSSTRACALAIAVATSSVNPASRCSIPAGSPPSRTDPTVMTPHSRPPTLIGAPAEERAPVPRATAVAAVASSVRCSTRAGSLLSDTRVATFWPPRLTQRPTQSASPILLQPPTNSITRPSP